MVRKYIPAKFQPTVRPDWLGVLPYMSDQEQALILKAILSYPNLIEIDSYFWEHTIKPDLEAQYESFKQACQLKGRKIKELNKGEDMYNISYPDVKQESNISDTKVSLGGNFLKGKGKEKEKVKSKDSGGVIGGEIPKKRYGEFRKVKLSDEEYLKLTRVYHEKLEEAIQILDDYLSAYGDKYKSHYAVLKSNNWVYNKIFKETTNDGDIKTFAKGCGNDPKDCYL